MFFVYFLVQYHYQFYMVFVHNNGLLIVFFLIILYFIIIQVLFLFDNNLAASPWPLEVRTILYSIHCLEPL